MKKDWKFIQEKDLFYEQVDGREHFWHYHPATIQEPGSFMVRVVIKAKEGHDFHVHPEMHEILYVLKGKAEQWIENEVQILEAGDSVFIQEGVVHATFNAGIEDLEFLAILSPPEGWNSGTVDMSQEQPYSELRTG